MAAVVVQEGQAHPSFAGPFAYNNSGAPMKVFAEQTVGLPAATAERAFRAQAVAALAGSAAPSCLAACQHAYEACLAGQDPAAEDGAALSACSAQTRSECAAKCLAADPPA